MKKLMMIVFVLAFLSVPVLSFACPCGEGKDAKAGMMKEGTCPHVKEGQADCSHEKGADCACSKHKMKKKGKKGKAVILANPESETPPAEEKK